MVIIIILTTTTTTRTRTTTKTTTSVWQRLRADMTATWQRHASLRTGMVTRKKSGRIPEGNPEGLLALTPT
eukprot:3479190-Karenia_brevis.AAC.1